MATLPRAGEGSWLHPAAVTGNAHGAAPPDMFGRGHLDHLALVARGAGARSVEDLGAMHAVWFQDPDGMKGEVCLIVDEQLRGFHAPRPMSAVAS